MPPFPPSQCEISIEKEMGAWYNSPQKRLLYLRIGDFCGPAESRLRIRRRHRDRGSGQGIIGAQAISACGKPPHIAKFRREKRNLQCLM